MKVLQKVVQAMDSRGNHSVLFQVTCKLLQSNNTLQINVVDSLCNAPCTEQKQVLPFFPESTHHLKASHSSL